MVQLMRVGIEISPQMQGSWSNDNDEMSKVVVESCKGMDNKLVANIKGFPQYYHRWSH